MNSKQLYKRYKFIKGGEISQKAEPVNSGRRGHNYIEMEEESPSEKFDDFFEYEKELSGLESSRNLASKALQDMAYPDDSDSYQASNNDTHSHIVMEDEPININIPKAPLEPIILDKKENTNNEDQDVKRKYNDVVGFDFIYCAYIKKNGYQCKRQAPKDKEYCSTHHKMVERDSVVDIIFYKEE